jgi:ferredoxin-type protein NapH
VQGGIRRGGAASPTFLKKLIAPAIVMLAFWALAAVMWQTSGYLEPLFFFGYIGTSVGAGLGLYAILPKRKKPTGRRLSLFLIGSFLFVVAALLGAENMQIEGLFFGVLTGVFQAAVVHYLIAKIFGPVLFGRLWCGWACWTVMILDLLPFTRPRGRLPGRWGWLRYAHFGLSLGLVLLLFYGFDYASGVAGSAAVYWFVIGNTLYYAVGIGLAWSLQDNRAFCKYLCPVAVPLKVSSRFSLLRIKGDASLCNECDACVRMCPMDIRIPEYIMHRERVLSSECSLCQTCISVCPKEALKLSFGFDIGGKDLLRERRQGALALDPVAPSGRRGALPVSSVSPAEGQSRRSTWTGDA